MGDEATNQYYRLAALKFSENLDKDDVIPDGATSSKCSELADLTRLDEEPFLKENSLGVSPK